MYHCNIQFYLIGKKCGIFELVKGITSLEHFTHTFLESDEPEESLIRQADVILADLQGTDAGNVLQRLIMHKKKEAELILLVGGDQTVNLADDLSEVEDMWIAPISEKELEFRFRRLQRDYKLRKDLWQSDQFLNACINSSPDMIWFKDKEGIHEIVNDSFCKVVNKTKDQVQGRGHAYIWNVEQEDPACVESEREVMQKRET